MQMNGAADHAPPLLTSFIYAVRCRPLVCRGKQWPSAA